MKSKYSESNPEPFWSVGTRPTVERSAKQYVRRVGDILIVFWSKDTIYVMSGSQRFIINRWFDTRRVYREWKGMCDSLKRRNNLDLTDIRQLAITHGFQICGFTKLPDGIEQLTKLNEEYKWAKKQ